MSLTHRLRVNIAHSSKKTMQTCYHLQKYIWWPSTNPNPKPPTYQSWEVSCNTGQESISELDSTFCFLSSQAVPKPAAQDNGSVRGEVWVCVGEAREQRGFKVVWYIAVTHYHHTLTQYVTLAGMYHSKAHTCWTGPLSRGIYSTYMLTIRLSALVLTWSIFLFCFVLF